MTRQLALITLTSLLVVAACHNDNQPDTDGGGFSDVLMVDILPLTARVWKEKSATGEQWPVELPLEPVEVGDESYVCEITSMHEHPSKGEDAEARTNVGLERIEESIAQGEMLDRRRKELDVSEFPDRWSFRVVGLKCTEERTGRTVRIACYGVTFGTKFGSMQVRIGSAVDHNVGQVREWIREAVGAPRKGGGSAIDEKR
jgi:hypothetical protein